MGSSTTGVKRGASAGMGHLDYTGQQPVGAKNSIAPQS